MPMQNIFILYSEINVFEKDLRMKTFLKLLKHCLNVVKILKTISINV